MKRSWLHPLDKYTSTAHGYFSKKCPFLYCVASGLAIIYGLCAIIVGMMWLIAKLPI